MLVGSAAAILTTLNSVKKFGCLYLHRYTRHGLLPPPTFKAFNLPQTQITTPVSSWRSGWKLLTADVIWRLLRQVKQQQVIPVLLEAVD